jgi:hypothetical protein
MAKLLNPSARATVEGAIGGGLGGLMAVANALASAAPVKSKRALIEARRTARLAKEAADDLALANLLASRKAE